MSRHWPCSVVYLLGSAVLPAGTKYIHTSYELHRLVLKGGERGGKGMQQVTRQDGSSKCPSDAITMSSTEYLQSVSVLHTCLPR